MKAYELQARLNELINKKILLDGKKGHVIRWQLKDDMLKITMNTADIVLLGNDIQQGLNRITMLDDEPLAEVMHVPNTTLIHRVGMEISELLLDNIKRVKDDKEYIPQAQEINSNIKTMIDLAKAEIEYMKTLSTLQKSM
jgi:hypothetical protein